MLDQILRNTKDGVKQPENPKLLDILGPGLITGASDDDPSGIATYSQAGAQFGYSLGWVMLFSWPLMCAIGWHVGLSRKLNRAKGFYAILAGATLVGAVMNYTTIDPVKALFWSAVINGVVAVPVMATMMLLSSNQNVMGDFSLPPFLKGFGWLATLVMAVAAFSMIATWAA